MIERIEIKRFKRILSASIALSRINLFVGGNNSGKSCILQGIHFGVALAQARYIAGADQFSADRLRYCPTEDFLNLSHGQRLHEGTNIEMHFYEIKNEAEYSAEVSLTRGRNGVVKARVKGGELLGTISDPRGFYSIYVPGLAGITIREEYRSELVVNNGIARGDANLFLRNLLLRIERSETRKSSFNSKFQRVFPNCSVNTDFSESDHLIISSRVTISNGSELPLDMVGTGMLQAIQLIAYITMYEPQLLLLDEPDAHLHPSNQKLLAKTLEAIVAETKTKVLIATHSRHMLDAFSESEDAKLYWVKDGTATEHAAWDDVAVLMDLGSLDKGERLLSGSYKFLVWTEDEDLRYLTALLRANGILEEEALIFSYQASSKVDAAKLMAAFLKRMRPGVKTIIHRDRDFMSDEEVRRLKEKYSLSDDYQTSLFITRGSDIEAYFCDPEHVSKILSCDINTARLLIEETIQENQNDFALKFQSKRNDIKVSLYKRDPEACPSPDKLLSGSIVPVEKALGKLLLKRLATKLQARGINGGAMLQKSDALIDMTLQACLTT